MKVIVAGMIKTGTKSMALALEQLGFNVYDFMEHYEYHGNDWNEILTTGKTATAETFQRMYADVDAVTDVPACYFWEEIHKAFPDAKIILTIRDNEDMWFRSTKRQAIENFPFPRKLTTLLSPTNYRFIDYCDKISVYTLGTVLLTNWFSGPIVNEVALKTVYRRHTAHVLQNAPKDKLLVFNVNEGWEPLCKFLNVEVPTNCFPHQNANSGMLKSLIQTNRTFLKIKREMKISVSILVLLLAYACFHYLFMRF